MLYDKKKVLAIAFSWRKHHDIPPVHTPQNTQLDDGFSHLAWFINNNLRLQRVGKVSVYIVFAPNLYFLNFCL